VFPFLERDIFTQVIDGLCNEWKSFIIHGPYQSGKTTFLLALERALKNSNIEPIYFEMTGVKGSINKQMDLLDLYQISFLGKHSWKKNCIVRS